MKPFLKSILVFASVLLISSAMAEGTGWNVGASVGASELRDESGDCDGTLSCDTSDVGYKVSAGYSFMPNFAIEMAYVDLGEANFDYGLGDTASFSDTGFAAYGIGIYPVDDFSLYAKVGFSNLKTKVSVVSATSVPPVSGSISSTNTNFAWGIGAGYNFTRNISAALEWERFQAEFSPIDTLDLGTRDVDLFSVSAKYHF